MWRPIRVTASAPPSNAASGQGGDVIALTGDLDPQADVDGRSDGPHQLGDAPTLGFQRDVARRRLPTVGGSGVDLDGPASGGRDDPSGQLDDDLVVGRDQARYHYGVERPDEPGGHLEPGIERSRVQAGPVQQGGRWWRIEIPGQAPPGLVEQAVVGVGQLTAGGVALVRRLDDDRSRPRLGRGPDTARCDHMLARGADDGVGQGHPADVDGESPGHDPGPDSPSAPTTRTLTRLASPAR